MTGNERIYVDGTSVVALTIKLDVGFDLSSGTTVEAVKIGYKKPDDTIGAWIGSVDEDDSHVIKYSTGSGTNDIDQVGQWILWSQVVFEDDRVSCGRPINLLVSLSYS